MLSVFSPLRDLTSLSVAVRLLLAFFCGGLIGLERSYKNRPAGFRTHILVCIASAVASMTGLYLYLNQGLPTDISRMGAQIISGLGFIGAGTIFVTKKPTVRGLTTAAGLWASGIIGLAIGGGFYEGGLLATAMVLITEIYFSRVTQRLRHMQAFLVILSYREKPVLDQVMRLCKDQRLAIENLQVSSDSGAQPPEYLARLMLRPRRKIERELLLAKIRAIPGVLEVTAEDLDTE